MIVVNVCETCGMQTVADDADKIMDEAFQREHGKLKMSLSGEPRWRSASTSRTNAAVPCRRLG
jgi:hypothetical protein